MADFMGRSAAASAVADATAAPARINSAGEIVTTPWEIQMLMEGRVFVAGIGIEETEINSEAALNDTTPSFALVAPSGGVVVIPLWFRLYFDTEGGAAPDWKLAYVQADKSAYNAGTVLPALNCLGGSGAPSAQANFMHTLSSVTAITDAQNVVLDERLQVLDNFISAEAITTVQGEEFPGGESTMQLLWKPPFPIGLYAGSMLACYAYTGTADSEYNVAMTWIEVPTTYKP